MRTSIRPDPVLSLENNVKYRYTPQVMPTETRATGSGLNLASGRLGSLAAPLIATYTDVGTSVPIWICLGLYIFIGILALLLPFKPSNIDIMT